jgi:hypothetical protein
MLHANRWGRAKENAMRKLALVVLLVAGLVSPAMTEAADVKYVGGPYQVGDGGEFTFQVISGLSTGAYVPGVTRDLTNPPSFQTFCLETNEGLGLGTYGAYVNPLGAVDGGFGGGNPDPVSLGTGWLYSQFVAGTLENYDFDNTGVGRQTSADLLQRTIWWLENENPLRYGSLVGNPFYDAVVAMFADPQADGGTTDYGVYALNLWRYQIDPETGERVRVKRQDVLFIGSVPDGGTTLMLLGGALIGLGALRRKIR